jgi:hypothetical protein
LPHILCHKLCILGVSYAMILWLIDFLTNRKQSAKVNKCKSSRCVINTGLPQGCVLSALLFIIYKVFQKGLQSIQSCCQHNFFLEPCIVRRIYTLLTAFGWKGLHTKFLNCGVFQ